VECCAAASWTLNGYKEKHPVASDGLAFLDTGADARELRKLIDHHHLELSVSRQFVL
jgi:hypothetical protein